MRGSLSILYLVHQLIPFPRLLIPLIGAISSYGLRKQTLPVKGCRTIGKRDMKLNDFLPKITVDPETYRVDADGVECTVEAADKLPMTQSVHFF